MADKPTFEDDFSSAPPPVPLSAKVAEFAERRHDTMSDKELHESDSPKGPWTKAKEILPSPRPGRRSWRQTKPFTTLQ